MSYNIAVLDGYTKELIAHSNDGSMNVFILVKPDTDLDSVFKAWDSDNQEFIRMAGWNWTFEEVIP